MTPLLTRPQKGNKYFIPKSMGGYNPCILGNPKALYGRDKEFPNLPNCVGWAIGRFNMIAGNTKCDYCYVPGHSNAKQLLENAKAQGLKTGREPQVGGIMVWTGGSDGYGHVGVCETKIGKIVKLSQSGWTCKYKANMWVADHEEGSDGNWLIGGDYSWMRGKYRYLGCIYNPALEAKKTEDDEVVQAQTYVINGKKVSIADNILKNGSNHPGIRAIADAINQTGKVKITVGYENGLPTLEVK